MNFSPQIERAIAPIVGFPWPDLDEAQMLCAAVAYYYFSVQFRENLQLACDFFPEDPRLRQLLAEECETANLSPYPGIAAPGEAMNHDTFMQRALALAGDQAIAGRCVPAGEQYLRQIREVAPLTRALSIPTYEDGGLERLFRAMLTAPDYDHPTLRAFRYFMERHIGFDSDPELGHGQLSRQLPPDDDVAKLWDCFRNLLTATTPCLALVLS